MFHSPHRTISSVSLEEDGVIELVSRDDDDDDDEEEDDDDDDDDDDDNKDDDKQVELSITRSS